MLVTERHKNYEQKDSSFSHHDACPECGSSDAMSIYTDGHGFCFACNHWMPPTESAHQSPTRRPTVSKDLILDGSVQALTKRGLNEETVAKWKYQVGSYKERPVQIANYIRDGITVAQKVRFADKSFVFLGDAKDCGLYGMHLWRDGGKMVVITEGEIDALSVSQLQGNKWAVVSVPNGAQGAKKALMKNLEWLEQFESVILMFDNDDPGKDATHECAPLFTPGKCKVAALPLKDANEMLLAGRGKEVIDAIWGARTYRPDGIISSAETWELVSKKDVESSFTYPYSKLNELLGGIRPSELVTITAGSGIGKSLMCREIAYHLSVTLGESVGYVALEETVKRTALGFMTIAANKPLHINQEGVSDDELKAAWDSSLGTGRVYLYDHWGSLESDNLLSKLRYLARGCGCRWLVLDHISIVVSGIGDGDERRLIDNTMTALRSLVNETGVGLILVSHLKRPEGNRGHEDGLHTSLAHLRGSAAIAQLSDIVVGLERNQQAEDSNSTTVRILKNRFNGITGEAGKLRYDAKTGRLLEDNTSDYGFKDETEDLTPTQSAGDEPVF